MDKAALFLKRLYIQMKYYRYGWRGNYASWKEALENCGGYNAANILEKVKAATLKVKSGEAVYERDSILYTKIEYSWPLLANLLWIAGMYDNHLAVIDFGGSMGTSYFQNRLYLNQLKKLTWSVVEQPDFVTAGKKEIASEQLDFFETTDAAIAAKGPHHVLLMSCVLPYLEKPYELLKNIADKQIPYIIIENTYFNTQPSNRLTIQKVPPVFYDASYPAWFLNYDEVIMTLIEKYDMVAEYINEQFLYLKGEKIMYQGFIMKLKTSD
jgi:putative methyltransferase (TIGR04325 family)